MSGDALFLSTTVIPFFFSSYSSIRTPFSISELLHLHVVVLLADESSPSVRFVAHLLSRREQGQRESDDRPQFLDVISTASVRTLSPLREIVRIVFKGTRSATLVVKADLPSSSGPALAPSYSQPFFDYDTACSLSGVLVFIFFLSGSCFLPRNRRAHRLPSPGDDLILGLAKFSPLMP